MFTGIIESIGTVISLSQSGEGKRLLVKAEFAENLNAGESVAIDGVCLTVSGISEKGFFADISRETLLRTTLGSVARGSQVNLERALRADGRFGGHIVQGHIDCPGKVLWLKRTGKFASLAVGFPSAYLKYIVEKGSIAVSGVSLTVSKVFGEKFEAAIIPETLERTTLNKLRPGGKVNLEFDVFAKYIESIIKS